jgi:sortase A
MLRLRVKYSSGWNLRSWTRWITLGLASVCLVWSGWDWIDQSLHQAEDQRQFQAALTEPQTPAPVIVIPEHEIKPASPPPVHARPPMAKLEIARLQVSGFVEDGFDARTLNRAIGHSPRSAKFGERGNIVLAAHRDTFFAGLRNVKVGDVIDLHSAAGVQYQYKVSRILIVDPSDSWVMKSSPREDMLTLITCYPFQFVGSAPSRFVVQAQPITPVEASRERPKAHNQRM